MPVNAPPPVEVKQNEAPVEEEEVKQFEKKVVCVRGDAQWKSFDSKRTSSRIVGFPT